jgi:hypothetical protein
MLTEGREIPVFDMNDSVTVCSEPCVAQNARSGSLPTACAT